MSVPASTPATEVDESTLSDQQLKEGITTGSVTPTPEPPPEPEKETPEKIPPAPTPAETPPETAPEKMYADKYKTVDDLAKGLIEVGKPLGYNQKFLERMVELAKKTGDWSTVEQTYKDLFDDLSAGKKVNAPEKPATAEPSPDTPSVETQAQRETVEFQVIVDETYRALENHPLIAEMQAAGCKIPKTTEEFNQMKIDFPYFASRFGDLYFKTFSDLKTEVKEYTKAVGEVETHNLSAKESAKQQIGETLAELKLVGIPEADIQKAIEDALKSDSIYETRHGVKFIRDGAILEHFLAKDFRRLSKLIQTNGQIEGRTQHTEDLEAMKKKGLNSISTVPIPGARKKEPAPIDVNDDTQVSSISDEDLKAHLTGKKPLKTS